MGISTSLSELHRGGDLWKRKHSFQQISNSSNQEKNKRAREWQCVERKEVQKCFKLLTSAMASLKLWKQPYGQVRRGFVGQPWGLLPPA